MYRIADLCADSNGPCSGNVCSRQISPARTARTASEAGLAALSHCSLPWSTRTGESNGFTGKFVREKVYRIYTYIDAM
jgi:hypothetical protein